MKSIFKGLTHTTPFPNVLIDVAMPRLKDTSWRVLCVIVRQTLGWRDGASNRRKDRDWLTRSQLKARTGRNSEAIARAIDTLVRQGYITAQNSEGMPLKTPRERRKNHGRIFYGLTGYWQEQIGLPVGLGETRKSEQLPLLAGSIFRGDDRETQYDRKTQHVASQEPNTTKETQTKIEITLSPEVVSFIEVFQKQARKHLITPDVALSSASHSRLQRWLQETDEERRIRTLQQYFCSNWISIVRQNYSLSAFANICSILRVDKTS